MSEIIAAFWSQICSAAWQCLLLHAHSSVLLCVRVTMQQFSFIHKTLELFSTIKHLCVSATARGNSSSCCALPEVIHPIISPNPFHALFSLQNPDIVLVHYLNVPAIEDCGKPCGPILCSINTDKKEWAKWTKEELIGQLKPMCEYFKHHLRILDISCSFSLCICSLHFIFIANVSRKYTLQVWEI